jgi:glycosyltransferase involved in cell wall biosynthesis
MKVAILTFHKYEEVAGGTEIFVRYLQEAFPGSDVISYSSSTTGQSANLERLNLQEVKMGMAIGNRFHRANKLERYDLVISNSIAGWYVSILRPGIPIVNVHHLTLIGLAESIYKGTPGYYPSKYFRSQFERIGALRNVNVSVSNKTRRELMQYYGKNSIVIENGVPLDVFYPLSRDEARETLGIEWDGPIGIFVGRAEYAKGFDIIQRISRKMRDIRILCVTGSNLFDENLIVRRNVPNSIMNVFYSAADFFIFPSRYESASYSALEAMACDLPVVVSRTGIFEDVAEEGVGRIVDSFHDEDFIKAIDQVLSMDRIETRKLVAKRFSLERFILDYRNLADKLVSHSHDRQSS